MIIALTVRGRRSHPTLVIFFYVIPLFKRDCSLKLTCIIMISCFYLPFFLLVEGARYSEEKSSNRPNPIFVD